MWLRVFEIWLTTRLLSSPTFHRGVRSVHKKVSELRHGKDPAEMGGTNIDNPDQPNVKKFVQYYIDELKEQLRGGSSPKK